MLSPADITKALRALGVEDGDLVLARAGLRAIGPVEGGANGFLDGLLGAVGATGTVVSLAFTQTAFIRPANPVEAFTDVTPTYAGALPQVMLDRPGRARSHHPQCSFVAIGRDAEEMVSGHGPRDGAYEPVRKLMAAGGKGLLVGCLDSSPGFTTAHLAETDLGLHRRIIFPKLNSVYYFDDEGEARLYRRTDPGLCSMSFRKFYAPYEGTGLLRRCLVGEAQSLLMPLATAYGVERAILEKNPKFTVCGNPTCATCNARRWDRLHRTPGFLMRRIGRRWTKTAS
jgi:aminoglycoside N3'-acetyltransferase